MNQENIYQKVRSFIVKNKTSDVFKFLKEHFPEAESLTILESEYNEIRDAELKGKLDHNQIQIKKNQINDKLLTFAKVGDIQIPEKNSNRKIWKPLVYFLLLVLLWNTSLMYFVFDTFNKLHSKM